MKYPFPQGDLREWAYELIPVLEAPRPEEEEFYRHQKNLSSITSPYSVSRGDYLLLVDTSAGSVTLSLPTSKNDGWECEIVKTDAANRVIILPSGTDTLVGETSVEVYDQWTALKFRAVSGGFVIV